MKTTVWAAIGLLMAGTVRVGAETAVTSGGPAVPWGFESGVWKGIELSTNHVRTGTVSGLWKDHVVNKSVSTDKIAHDWSEFDEMRFWIFSEHTSKAPVMVVLVSRTDPKSFSYFSYRLTVDWEGWKEVRIPFHQFDSMRSPAGWQKIDSMALSVDGWGITPDPEAALYMTGLSLIKTEIKALTAEQKADLDVTKKQYCDYQRDAWKTSGSLADSEASVTGWMKSLTAEGVWPDVNYTNRTTGYWRTVDHITRLNTMCILYTSPESRFYHDAALSKVIHSALGHWLRKDYRNPNWWHNEIGVPHDIATLMLYLEGELSPQERAAGLRISSRAVIDSPAHGGRGALTGQNRVWVAGNALLRGLLVPDFALVQQARNVIFEEVVVATQAGGQSLSITRSGKPGEVFVSTQEGIQPDFTFFQHGPLLQFGNYGLAFASDMAMWMTVFRGTSLALDQGKLGIIRDYLLKGESTVVWKGVMDINSCGRQIGPRSPAVKGKSVLRILDIAKVADATHAPDYEAAIGQISPEVQAGAILPKNTHFWRADYMVQRRPDYFVSTRMSSSRVLAAELVNGENAQGAYLGDGATYIYLTGGEYEDIFPVWDWSRLPGVTSPVITDKQRLKPTNWKVTNHSDFVGGVSDGLYGVAALALNRDGLTAQKGWFYFDDQIVCLGAGITGTKEDQRITTGVNQCLARGDITVEAGQGPTALPEGLRELGALKWAWHDGVGYLFPEPQQITMGSQSQTGGWHEVSTSKPVAWVTNKVFSIWINHGVKPQEGSYRYILLPGASRAMLQTQADKPDITVLSNTPDLQAVRHVKLNMTQAIFYRPGTLAHGEGKTIAVDKPCVVLLHESKNQLSIADPTQKLADITVTLNGAVSHYRLPSGALAGSSYTAP